MKEQEAIGINMSSRDKQELHYAVSLLEAIAAELKIDITGMREEAKQKAIKEKEIKVKEVK